MFKIQNKKVPKHVAIIMDGNRRWATAQSREAIHGHKAGAKALINLCKSIKGNYNIQNLTVYAFSAENLSRESQELNNLFSLLDEYLDSDIKTLQKENINVNIFGDFSIFKHQTQNKIAKINNAHIQSCSYTLNIALNYGGRQELINAFKNISKNVQEVSQETISQNLYIPSMPDVELIIRTGGAQRLSNFLPWQTIYAELYFTHTLWPNFTEEDFKKAIEFYNSQQRNFGK